MPFRLFLPRYSFFNQASQKIIIKKTLTFLIVDVSLCGISPNKNKTHKDTNTNEN